MSYQVKLSKSAIDDIDDIIHYLSELSDVFAKVFLEESISNISYLEDSPLLFIKFRDDYRRLYLKRFRYHVIFKIDELQKSIKILAVIHESRDPQRWVKA